MNKRVLGDEEEIIAVNYLEMHGYEIIERNFRCRLGEIDIVARKDGYIVFIEVKYRSSLKYGHPSYAINKKKQQTIFNVAQVYLKKNNISFYTAIRFDAVLILNDHVEIIENVIGAF